MYKLGKTKQSNFELRPSGTINKGYSTDRMILVLEPTSFCTSISSGICCINASEYLSF